MLRIPQSMGFEGSPDQCAERIERALHLEFSQPVVDLLTAPPPL
jgi:hypothetical protein